MVTNIVLTNKEYEENVKNKEFWTTLQKQFKTKDDLIKAFINCKPKRDNMIRAKAILSGQFLEGIYKTNAFGGELFKALRHYTNDYFIKDPINDLESLVF